MKKIKLSVIKLENKYYYYYLDKIFEETPENYNRKYKVMDAEIFKSRFLAIKTKDLLNGFNEFIVKGEKDPFQSSSHPIPTSKLKELGYMEISLIV